MSAEPFIVRESDSWVLVWKPHDIPTAPLARNEQGTLLEWILTRIPQAASVRGKKEIEHGLLHRLDTGTEGLVLVAKTQTTFDFLDEAQKASKIIKSYRALCSRSNTPLIDPSTVFPFTIQSRFRSRGPGGREVKALFMGDRGYDEAKYDYRTTIVSIKRIQIDERTIYAVACRLDRGARHQVRSHLSHAGYPILGDRLYNDDCVEVPLQLCANGIDFPDPDSNSPVSILIQQPDKMSL